MTVDQLLTAVIVAALFVLRDTLDRYLRRRGVRRTREAEGARVNGQHSDTHPPARSEV